MSHMNIVTALEQSLRKLYKYTQNHCEQIKKQTYC